MSLQPEIQLTWKKILRSNLKYLYLVTIIYLIIFQQLNLHVLVYFQHRPETIVLYDPVLSMITPRPINLELNIFSYATLAILLIYLLAKPKRLLIVLHALLLMWMLRWLTMYLLPLATPPLKVPLHDVIAYSNYQISRDLFFSGHTATMVIMLCVIKNRGMLLFTFLMTLLIIALLLIGHQHYFLDIIAAPFFAYTCYRLSVRLNQFLIPLLARDKKQALAEKEPDQIGIS